MEICGALAQRCLTEERGDDFAPEPEGTVRRFWGGEVLSAMLKPRLGGEFQDELAPE